ncbi:MAG: hypothetical protein R2733_13485 [Acidimicrobiales bacterium]
MVSTQWRMVVAALGVTAATVAVVSAQVEHPPPSAEASDASPRPIADDQVVQEVVGACDLLAFAASADPALQYAAGRSPADIDAVAAIQRDALLAAAELVEPGPAADALAVMAAIFVDEDGTGPGRWGEDRWAEALIARADPALLHLLVPLEARC